MRTNESSLSIGASPAVLMREHADISWCKTAAADAVVAAGRRSPYRCRRVGAGRARLLAGPSGTVEVVDTGGSCRGPVDPRLRLGRSRVAPVGRAISRARRETPDRYPLTPRLYPTPLLSYDHREWTNNYIWMHKPPLALWLQAAAMKTFGVHELALRLPSVMISSAAVVLTFHIGATLFTPASACWRRFSRRSTDFSSTSASGRRVSDHVDTLLIFLFELGMLLALKGARRGSIATGVVLGAACGFAYLTKSLPALLMLPSGQPCGGKRHNCRRSRESSGSPVPSLR